MMKLRSGGMSSSARIYRPSRSGVFNEFLWSIAGGSAVPVSYRGIGSANGNRKRKASNQRMSVRVIPLFFNANRRVNCGLFQSLAPFCDIGVTSGNQFPFAFNAILEYLPYPTANRRRAQADLRSN